MDERDLYRELGRMIKGELSSAELKRIAEAEGCKSFSELCEARLPEELGKVRVGTRDLVAKIDRYRRRAIDLFELWFWADELYNISFNHRIAYEQRSEELILSALSALSVVSNERLFPNRQKTGRSIDYIRACLIRRRKLRMRNIFLRIFEDLECAHLANKSAAEIAAGEEDPSIDAAPPAGPARWADVVLLDRPFERGSDLYADYNWVIAFTVTTRELFVEEQAENAMADGEPAGSGEEPARPEEGEEGAFRFEIPGWKEEDDELGMGPGAGRPPQLRPTPREGGDEVDRVPSLRRLAPNFELDRWKPRYLYDGDGIAEIVLDVPEIGRAEVRYATKLFCLANRIRSCRLDDEEVSTLVVRPGAGRRAERP
jgi:hypothetical protein